jgi:predicted  nucleic acid-binding Zn-ribbon protein
MHPDLERLIKLQQLDGFAETARRTLAEHPIRSQALESRIDTAKATLETARQQLAANQTARRAIEKDLAAVQTRLSKYKDQLMEVKTNREYQAMQHEIEIAQTEVRTYEDRILERMLEADDLTMAMKRGEAALGLEQKAVAEERRRLEEELSKLQRELDAALADRQELVAGMDPQTVALFERVARVRHGVAVAEARDGVCTICHVRLRPQVFNDVRRNDSIIQCESCQRILYFAGAPVTASDAASA